VQEPVPMPVPSTTRRALFNDMLRFSVARILIFTFSIAPSMIPKCIVWTIENLSILWDRAHRVLHGTRIESLEKAPGGESPVELLEPAGNFAYVFLFSFLSVYTSGCVIQVRI